MTTQFLTREGYEKLQAELTHLKTVRRLEVAKRLQDAIDEGYRLSEDPEYEAAKNEQAFIEGRILDLEQLLATARIIENGQGDTVTIGSKVTIQEDGVDPEHYTIVGEAEANPREGRISNVSPLGKALIGHKVGDKVSVPAPSGTFEVSVLKVK
ncbi:MAG TPA: transcription elongation factor GreA [Anaerolineales bacterium]|nr:transcription elongation factor GreA [Anaerolineales bacterium]